MSIVGSIGSIVEATSEIEPVVAEVATVAGEVAEATAEISTTTAEVAGAIVSDIPAAEAVGGLINKIGAGEPFEELGNVQGVLDNLPLNDAPNLEGGISTPIEAHIEGSPAISVVPDIDNSLTGESGVIQGASSTQDASESASPPPDIRGTSGEQPDQKKAGQADEDQAADEVDGDDEGKDHKENEEDKDKNEKDDTEREVARLVSKMGSLQEEQQIFLQRMNGNMAEQTSDESGAGSAVDALGLVRIQLEMHSTRQQINALIPRLPPLKRQLYLVQLGLISIQGTVSSAEMSQ